MNFVRIERSHEFVASAVNLKDLSPRGDSRALQLAVKIERKKQSYSQRHGAENLLDGPKPKDIVCSK